MRWRRFSMSGEEVKNARTAVIKAALEYVEEGMVIGLGSGTTVAQMVEMMKNLVKVESLEFIPSSLQAKHLILSHGLRLASLDTYPEPDLVLDSFDQVDQKGNVIKGGGGALLREKILAQAGRKVIYIGDHLKQRQKLDRSVPLEVLEFAYPYVKKTLEKMGAEVRLREGKMKMGPVITDNGNLIVEADFGEIENPETLEQRLNMIAGVLENGIFIKPAHLIMIGYPDGRVEKRLVKQYE